MWARPGAGQTVKLVNQILVVGNALAMCEALLFAQAGGVDLQKTFDAISQGAAGSWMFTNRAPQIMRRDWRPGFTVDLQQKDLRLVLGAADKLGVPVVNTALVFNLYRTLQAQGLGGEGNHALIKALENMAGIQVGTPMANSPAPAFHLRPARADEAKLIRQRIWRERLDPTRLDWRKFVMAEAAGEMAREPSWALPR